MNIDYLPQNQFITKIEKPKIIIEFMIIETTTQKDFVNLDINANTNEDNIKNEKINKK